jgi:ribosome-associated heat shock protein Hsp15
MRCNATMVGGDDEALTDLRIDRWLWAARLYKTRGTASDACSAGHVKLEGRSAKPSKPVHRGQKLEATTPGGLRILEIVGLQARRGPAASARTLYEDHSPPPPPTEARPAPVSRDSGEGRPTKRDARRLRRLRDGD